MEIPKATPAQIRDQGIEALAKALGPIGMVWFLQQLETGSGTIPGIGKSGARG